MNLGYDKPDSLSPKSHIKFSVLDKRKSYSTIYENTTAQIWEPTTQTIKLKSSTILNLSKHAQYKSDTKTSP